ncbi:MAG: signal peptidase II [Streptosporangiaceae bacterium]
MRRAGYATALGVVAADQVTKALALAGVIPVRVVRNTGASFGIGAGHPLMVALIAAVITVGVAVLLARATRPVTAVLLGAVLGGAAGNLADRLMRSPGLGRGAVIDWIHLWGYPATFNLADVAIRVGALGAVTTALIRPRQFRRPRTSQSVRRPARAPRP